MDLETAAGILYGWPAEKTREILKWDYCFCGELKHVEDFHCEGCSAEKYRDMIDRREERDRATYPEDYL